MRRLTVLLTLLLLPPVTVGAEEDSGPGALHVLLAYGPNRILDVLDVARLRVRAGPGMAIALRATELGDLFIGSYLSVYAGLPGPRGGRLIRLPVGLEARSGLEISAADTSTGLGLAPDYGFTEVGFGFQAGLLGADVGIDPLEIADLVAGFFLIDLLDDDL